MLSLSDETFLLHSHAQQVGEATLSLGASTYGLRR